MKKSKAKTVEVKKENIDEGNDFSDQRWIYLSIIGFLASLLIYANWTILKQSHILHSQRCTDVNFDSLPQLSKVISALDTFLPTEKKEETGTISTPRDENEATTTIEKQQTGISDFEKLGDDDLEESTPRNNDNVKDDVTYITALDSDTSENITHGEHDMDANESEIDVDIVDAEEIDENSKKIDVEENINGEVDLSEDLVKLEKEVDDNDSDVEEIAVVEETQESIDTTNMEEDLIDDLNHEIIEDSEITEDITEGGHGEEKEKDRNDEGTDIDDIETVTGIEERDETIIVEEKISEEIERSEELQEIEQESKTIVYDADSDIDVDIVSTEETEEMNQNTHAEEDVNGGSDASADSSISEKEIEKDAEEKAHDDFDVLSEKEIKENIETGDVGEDIVENLDVSEDLSIEEYDVEQHAHDDSDTDNNIVTAQEIEESYKVIHVEEDVSKNSDISEDHTEIDQEDNGREAHFDVDIIDTVAEETEKVGEVVHVEEDIEVDSAVFEHVVEAEETEVDASESDINVEITDTAAPHVEEDVEPDSAVSEDVVEAEETEIYESESDIKEDTDDTAVKETEESSEKVQVEEDIDVDSAVSEDVVEAEYESESDIKEDTDDKAVKETEEGSEAVHVEEDFIVYSAVSEDVVEAEETEVDESESDINVDTAIPEETEEDSEVVHVEEAVEVDSAVSEHVVEAEETEVHGGESDINVETTDTTAPHVEEDVEVDAAVSEDVVEAEETEVDESESEIIVDIADTVAEETKEGSEAVHVEEDVIVDSAVSEDVVEAEETEVDEGESDIAEETTEESSEAVHVEEDVIVDSAVSEDIVEAEEIDVDNDITVLIETEEGSEAVHVEEDFEVDSAVSEDPTKEEMEERGSESDINVDTAIPEETEEGSEAVHVEEDFEVDSAVSEDVAEAEETEVDEGESGGPVSISEDSSEVGQNEKEIEDDSAYAHDVNEVTQNEEMTQKDLSEETSEDFASNVILSEKEEAPESSVAQKPSIDTNSDPNEAFVSGLDGLRHFLEPVDPPDDLDVGASGTSIQDILVGKGGQIVIKRLQKSLKVIKNNWEKVIQKIKQHLDLDDEDDSFDDQFNFNHPVKIGEQISIQDDDLFMNEDDLQQKFQLQLKKIVSDLDKTKLQLKKVISDLDKTKVGEVARSIWQICHKTIAKVKSFLDEIIDDIGGIEDEEEDELDLFDGSVEMSNFFSARGHGQYDDDISDLRRKIMENTSTETLVTAKEKDEEGTDLHKRSVEERRDYYINKIKILNKEQENEKKQGRTNFGFFDSKASPASDEGEKSVIRNEVVDEGLGSEAHETTQISLDIDNEKNDDGEGEEQRANSKITVNADESQERVSPEASQVSNEGDVLEVESDINETNSEDKEVNEIQSQLELLVDSSSEEALQKEGVSHSSVDLSSISSVENDFNTGIEEENKTKDATNIENERDFEQDSRIQNNSPKNDVDKEKDDSSRTVNNDVQQEENGDILLDESVSDQILEASKSESEEQSTSSDYISTIISTENGLEPDVVMENDFENIPPENSPPEIVAPKVNERIDEVRQEISQPGNELESETVALSQEGPGTDYEVEMDNDVILTEIDDKDNELGTNTFVNTTEEFSSLDDTDERPEKNTDDNPGDQMDISENEIQTEGGTDTQTSASNEPNVTILSQSTGTFEINMKNESIVASDHEIEEQSVLNENDEQMKTEPLSGIQQEGEMEEETNPSDSDLQTQGDHIDENIDSDLMKESHAEPIGDSSEEETARIDEIEAKEKEELDEETNSLDSVAKTEDEEVDERDDLNQTEESNDEPTDDSIHEDVYDEIILSDDLEYFDFDDDEIEVTTPEKPKEVALNEKNIIGEKEQSTLVTSDQVTTESEKESQYKKDLNPNSDNPTYSSQDESPDTIDDKVTSGIDNIELESGKINNDETVSNIQEVNGVIDKTEEASISDLKEAQRKEIEMQDIDEKEKIEKEEDYHVEPQINLEAESNVAMGKDARDDNADENFNANRVDLENDKRDDRPSISVDAEIDKGEFENSYSGRTSSIGKTSNNVPQRPNYGDNQKANAKFVSGLDGIDKFMEEVDVPDDLDVGAVGSSIQEVLLGQGGQILVKRVRKGADAVKESVAKIADRVKQHRRKRKESQTVNENVKNEESKPNLIKVAKKVWNFIADPIDDDDEDDIFGNNLEMGNFFKERGFSEGFDFDNE